MRYSCEAFCFSYWGVRATWHSRDALSSSVGSKYVIFTSKQNALKISKAGLYLYKLKPCWLGTYKAMALNLQKKRQYGLHRVCKPVYIHKPVIVQHINAPLTLVWAIVRRFGYADYYKPSVKSCYLISGNGDVGSIRERKFIGGLPAKNSIERLDTLDDNLHIRSFTVIGGDSRLLNHHSTMLLQEKIGEPDKTVVMESYRFETLLGNTEAETYYIFDKIAKFNLESLAFLAEKMNPASVSEKLQEETTVEHVSM